MAYFYINNRGKGFEAYAVLFFLNLALVSCGEEKIAVFQVGANKTCDATELNLKQNEVFRVLIYSNSKDMFSASSRILGDQIIPIVKTECIDNRSIMLQKYDSSAFKNNEVLSYKVNFPHSQSIVCNATIKISDPHGFQIDAPYFWLCITLGMLLMIVVIVETILIFYYKKKYDRAMLHEDDNEEIAKNSDRSNRRRYSSPPYNRKMSNRNIEASDIYESLEMPSEQSESERTPPSNHSTFPRAVAAAKKKNMQYPRNATTLERPKLPTPCDIAPQEDYEEVDSAPVLTSKISARMRAAPEPNLGTQHLRNASRTKRPKLPTPCDVVTQDDYEEMDPDPVLTSKISARTRAAPEPNLEDYEKIDEDIVLPSKKSAQAQVVPEPNVARPPKTVLSELSMKLSKKRGPVAPPKTSRMRMEKITCEQGGRTTPKRVPRPYPGNTLSGEGSNVWATANASHLRQPFQKVAPPLPSTPRPKHENLVRARPNPPRPQPTKTGTFGNIEISQCSSDEEWNEFDELKNYPIYNV